MSRCNKEVLVLAIAKEQKGSLSLFWATRSKGDPIAEIFYVAIPEEGEPESIFGAEEKDRIWLCLAGVGNKADVSLLAKMIKVELQTEINTWGFYPTIVQTVLANVGSLLSSVARSKIEDYDAELGIISYFPLSGEMSFYRLKSDGHFHQTNQFIILGGREKLAESEESLRHNLREELKNIYSAAIASGEELPQLRRVYKIVRKYLKLIDNKSAIWSEIKKGILLSFE